MNYSAVVLGIDAAWTAGNPSGVALVAEAAGQWRALAVTPSYAAFTALADADSITWTDRFKGSDPDPAALIRAAAKMAGGGPPDLVAADIPLARTPIEGRREADRIVSKVFGRAGCSTHSPNRERPGTVSEKLRKGFQKCGYPLATSDQNSSGCRLLETYPHPALLSLTGAKMRLPYKVAKSGKYWKGLPRAQRAERIHNVFLTILRALEAKIQNVSGLLPSTDECRSLAFLKRYEDAIDALVCCWVGIEYLNGRAIPYGDETAAIWIP